MNKQVFLEFWAAISAERTDIPQGAIDFVESLKQDKVEKKKEPFTENGALILSYMQEVESTPGMDKLKAKDIGEGLFIASKTVSGAIRKLVTDGYVEKVGADPVIYSLTQLGASTNVKK